MNAARLPVLRNNAVGVLKQPMAVRFFLDEIGDMPSDAQTRLLRVLSMAIFIVSAGTPLSMSMYVLSPPRIKI